MNGIYYDCILYDTGLGSEPIVLFWNLDSAIFGHVVGTRAINYHICLPISQKNMYLNHSMTFFYTLTYIT